MVSNVLIALCPCLALLCEQENRSLENQIHSRACSDRAVFSPSFTQEESLQRDSSPMCHVHVACPHHCLLCKDLVQRVLVQFGEGLKVKGGTTGKTHRKKKRFHRALISQVFLSLSPVLFIVLISIPKITSISRKGLIPSSTSQYKTRRFSIKLDVAFSVPQQEKGVNT